MRRRGGSRAIERNSERHGNWREIVQSGLRLGRCSPRVRCTPSDRPTVACTWWTMVARHNPQPWYQHSRWDPVETHQNLCVSDSSTWLCYNIAVLHHEVHAPCVQRLSTTFIPNPATFQTTLSEHQRCSNVHISPTRVQKCDRVFSLFASRPISIPILSSECPL